VTGVVLERIAIPHHQIPVASLCFVLRICRLGLIPSGPIGLSCHQQSKCGPSQHLHWALANIDATRSDAPLAPFGPPRLSHPSREPTEIPYTPAGGPSRRSFLLLQYLLFHKLTSFSLTTAEIAVELPILLFLPPTECGALLYIPNTLTPSPSSRRRQQPLSPP
jgi:hypothetical protein